MVRVLATPGGVGGRVGSLTDERAVGFAVDPGKTVDSTGGRVS